MYSCSCASKPLLTSVVGNRCYSPSSQAQGELSCTDMIYSSSGQYSGQSALYSNKCTTYQDGSSLLSLLASSSSPSSSRRGGAWGRGYWAYMLLKYDDLKSPSPLPLLRGEGHGDKAYILLNYDDMKSKPLRKLDGWNTRVTSFYCEKWHHALAQIQVSLKSHKNAWSVWYKSNYEILQLLDFNCNFCFASWKK